MAFDSSPDIHWKRRPVSAEKLYHIQGKCPLSHYRFVKKDMCKGRQFMQEA